MTDDEAPRGPYAMEQDVLAILPDLIAKRDAATDKRERKQLDARVKSCRSMVKWCRSRAGYVRPHKSVPCQAGEA